MIELEQFFSTDFDDKNKFISSLYVKKDSYLANDCIDHNDLTENHYSPR